MTAVRVGASERAAPARLIAPRRGMRLSPDGRLLVVLLAVTLVGPYFPLFEWLGYPEPTTREVRLDNLLLPALAAFVFVRCLVTGRLRAPVHVVLYGTFCAWLVLVTALWAGKVPGVYGGSPDLITLVKGGDAYIRPLLMLFITANVRVTRHDLMVIVRLVLAVAVLLAVVAVAQLTPGTGRYVNLFLVSHYDNTSADYFWAVLQGGRVAALMPQLSTLGMYMVLVLGVLGSQFFGARPVRSRVLFSLVVAAALAGGILCGSKVFAGGLLLTAALMLLWWRRPRRWNVATPIAMVAAGVALWFIVATFFPLQAERFSDRIPTSGGGFYEQYLASRFEPGSGKVYRTGAVEIASKYPLSGLGLNVVGNTTDSLALGVVIMSGTVGAVLFLGAIGAGALHLHSVSRTDRDPDVAGLARTMLVLTLVFLVTAVGFHTFIQDRAGDAYWMILGLLAAPAAPFAPGARGAGRPGRDGDGPGPGAAHRAGEGSARPGSGVRTANPQVAPRHLADVSGERSPARRSPSPGQGRTTSHGD